MLLRSLASFYACTYSCFVCVLCRFHPRFLRFGALYIPNHIKTKNKRKNIPAPIDESLMFPLAVNYDADIHDALESLRILDGTIPRHAKHGAPVLFCSSAHCQVLCQTEYSCAWVSAL
jgi:hypothetical protein